MVPGVRDECGPDAARRNPVRNKRSPHCRVLLQGTGAGAARGLCHRSARRRRGALDQGPHWRLTTVRGDRRAIMAVYTVHEPPHEDPAEADTDQFVFVRDGFYFWAFLFGPLWMIWRRLWLVLLLYLI